MKILTEKKLRELIEKSLHETGEKQEMNRMLSDVQEHCIKLEWRIERLENELLHERTHAVAKGEDNGHR